MKKFGALLDCSRNAVMKTEEVKNLICTLEKLGYNCLMLYTEDTYTLDNEPFFGYLRGRYKKDELRQLDVFGRAHGIELIPCIETLGHLEKIFEWKEYAPINDCDGILLADDENTYRLIEKMFASCAECFSSRIVHIGMDEAHALGLGKYLTRHGYRDRFDIFCKHLDRVAKIAEKYGFRPIIWSDMFFRIALGGEYVCEEGEIPEKIAERVPENVSVAYWDYFSADERTYEKMLDKHSVFRREIWFAGGAVKTCGFHSANAISIDRLGKSIKACLKKNIENIIITMWSDGGAECPAAAVLPSLTYAAECVRGNFGVDGAKSVFEKLFDVHWDDFMLCDLAVTDLPKQDDIGTGAKEMLYSDYFCGRFQNYVSDDGRERRAYAEYAEKFHAAERGGGKFRLMFAYYGALCRVLSVKYDLGYRSRKFYREGNAAGLKSLLSEYRKTEKELKAFISAFEKMWFYFHKPFGFETHEMRLGGVLLRTESCRRRISEYLRGKTESIPELEEELLARPDGCENGCLPFSNSYLHIATVNTI